MESDDYVLTEVVVAILRATNLLGLNFNSPLLEGEPVSDATLTTVQLYEYWGRLGAEGALTLTAAIAGSVEPGQLGLLDYVIHNAPTVRVALHHLTHHLDYSYKGAQLNLAVEGELAKLHYQSPNIIDGAAEWTVAFAHARIGAMVGQDWQLHEARFQFEAPSETHRFQSHLGCPVLFSQPATALLFSRRFLEYPVQGSQPSLYRVLCRQLERELYERRCKSLKFGDRVQATLEDNLRQSNTTREQLASRMLITPSELSACLKEEGFSSFVDYLDSVRREIAERRLVYESKSMSDIAAELGYASNSTLTRACQRWFGMSPSAYRRSQR